MKEEFPKQDALGFTTPVEDWMVGWVEETVTLILTYTVMWEPKAAYRSQPTRPMPV